MIVLQTDAVTLPADRWPEAVAQMVAHTRPEWTATGAAVGLAALGAAGACALDRGRGAASVALAVATAAALPWGPQALLPLLPQLVR
ncbi:MAG: hypothetical protein R3F59_15625 [Myxococcota bacterium]